MKGFSFTITIQLKAIEQNIPYVGITKKRQFLVWLALSGVQTSRKLKIVLIPLDTVVHVQSFTIGHFRIVFCLAIKARLGAQPFARKLLLFACEWKLIVIWKAVDQRG